jgi:hypothetical protein
MDLFQNFQIWVKYVNIPEYYRIILINLSGTVMCDAPDENMVLSGG